VTSALRLRRFVLGARPRTLAAAVTPVAVGTAQAAEHGPVPLWRALGALVVAVSLQVGVNYLNDYQDGVRGVDRDRVGPPRLTASGWAAPASVRRAAFAGFGVAAAAGLGLALATSLWLLPVGAACLLAAGTYTGGPRPYGHAGLGELAVFVCFGLVAVVGTASVEMDRAAFGAVLPAVPVGLLAAALLLVNNLRDREGDARAGKRTLAVLLGDRAARSLYAGLVLLALAWPAVLAPSHPRALVALASAPLALAPLRRVLGTSSGHALLPALAETARLEVAFGLALAVGLW
jgi:1,4-dihydroxy-2-naphthoate octaprenyltransferase